MLTFVQSLNAQSVHESLRKGDRQYNKDNYKAAERHYRIAADLEYSNPKALYNLGNSLYQQGNWENAAERFDQAARFSKNSIDQANALHNLGNAYLKQRKFKEAVEAYENSLRLRPGDVDSKINLQMAKKNLEKEAQNQQKNQQNQNQPKDDNQDENQSQSSENQQDNPPKKPQDQKQQNQSGQPQQPSPQQAQPQAGKMKQEDARRILETAVGPDDQRNVQKYRSAQPKSQPKGSKKDW